MTVINEVLLAVIGLAQATNPYAKITIGALLADNGLAISQAAGAPLKTFLDKGSEYRIPLALNGKHTNQLVLSETLNLIHHALTMTKVYPSATGWQITNISTIAAPSYIGREQNSQYLYGSSLEVKFYYRKD